MPTEGATRGVQRAARILIAFVMVVILFASVGKLLDLAAFRSSLRTWEGLPQTVKTPLAIAVPLVEMAIAGGWLVGLSRTRAALAAMALLVVFTVAYGAHWAFIAAPTCDCFGRIAQFKEDNSTAVFVVARNAVLIGALGFGLWLGRARVNAITPHMGSGQNRPVELHGAAARPGLRAFTLIEVLLVMAIVGVLTALLAPSFAGVRVQAQRTAGLAKMAQHARGFIAYTVEFRELWPAITSPTATYTVLRGGDQVYKAEYFDAVFAWPVPLADVLYGSTWRDRSFAWKGDVVSPFGGGFWYSAAFMASPAFWNASTRTGPSQWGPTRAPDVLFPSSKALIVRVARTQPGELDHSLVWFVMVDGSGIQLHERDTKPAYPNGTGTWQGSSEMSMTFPGLATVDGVHGRDR